MNKRFINKKNQILKNHLIETGSILDSLPYNNLSEINKLISTKFAIYDKSGVLKAIENN